MAAVTLGVSYWSHVDSTIALRWSTQANWKCTNMTGKVHNRFENTGYLQCRLFRWL